MSWMLSIWAAAALLALCRGENTVHEGNSLSVNGYHLCIRNETRIVTFLAMHMVPYPVTESCGDWLLWKTCTVTRYRNAHQTEYKTVVEQVTRCCDGYVQVGRYCALPVNRSGEFTAKPGSCPTADGLYPGSEDCEWDMDCPGWQKCCQRSDRSLCSDPASSANYSESGGHRFNATVTVKTDYEPMMSKDRGHLNHTRLLQAMVTGALQSDVSVYFLSSWPVHPYRTATSLLIDCSSALSLYNVTSKLHLLLKHIQEVSSVTVEADIRVSTTTEPPLDYLPPKNTTYIPASSTTQDPQGNSTTGLLNATETSTAAPLTNTSPVPYSSSHAPQWTSSAPHTSMSSTIESPLPTATCSPPNITSLWSANVTGTSFCVYWSSQFQMNQTYRLVVSNWSEVIHSLETNQTMMEVGRLKPGTLYNVTVTPLACGSQGSTLRLLVRTDAQTLDATARLTNVQFTADLQNTSSQAYKALVESITQEISWSLSPEIKAMVDSGQMRLEIRGFSPGSVVVNFTLVFIPSQSQDISNVSTALLHSLMNSTKYTVDRNNTRIMDFNECASGENDCSQWATCTNSWASYTCACMDGFTDSNPERPGRACQAMTTVETVTPPLTPTVFSTVSATPSSQITPTTSDPPLITVTTTPGITTTITSTSETVSTTVPSTSLVSATSPAMQTALPFETTAQATTTSTTVATTPASTTSSTAPTTTFTAPATTATATTSTTTAPTSTTTAPTTTITAPTTTITSPTTTITAPMTSTIASTTTIAAPAITTTVLTANTSTLATTTSTAATTTYTTTTAIDPTTTPSAPTTTTATLTTTAAPTSTTTPTTTTTAMTSTLTLTPTPVVTSPTTPLTTLTTNTTALTIATKASMPGAISVQCRVAAITVTIVRDFLLSTKITESALYLGLPECGVNGGNATHAQLTVAWNECATRLVHNETHYTASITLFNTMDPYNTSSGTVEAPRIRLEVPIMCAYMKSMLISTDFGSMGYDMIKDVIMGSGSFQVTVRLMNGTMPLPHNYSLSPGEAVVVDVSLNTSSEHIKVVIDKCWATPTQSPIDTNSHVFLENSCSLNTYVKVLMNGNSSTSRVSVQIFSIVNLDVIYLHCQVQICAQIGSDTCVPDCLQRTARSSNTIGRAFGSSGPLLKSDEDDEEQKYDMLHIVGLSCLGIGLSLFFIVGFVCLFYYQRNRIGHYNFSVKPKQENFTYLVFNT
ncbi:uromodulin-like 1 isoform X2 [Chelmon rostratus]|uniref:uromodulin-like 1 isoform X2 n=1 Tax=Chelmon rostratus TaxID=109905 RepID=UPI001BEB9A1C|nr:uromodulin-like 1 isoform X2 [Chelmon rostratus]